MFLLVYIDLLIFQKISIIKIIVLLKKYILLLPIFTKFKIS